MPFRREISPETERLLQRIKHNSGYYQVRQRSHCLLLRKKGFKIRELVDIFDVSQKTVCNWLKAWEDLGLLGLYDRKGRGRKPTFNQKEKETIKLWVEENSKQLKTVQKKIEQQWNKTVSTKTIKRIIKGLKMSWHRIRRICAGKPPENEYQEKKWHLEELKKLDEQRKIDLYYLDESGFSLTSNVPYAWQNIGSDLEVETSRSKRLNVLGIMNRRGHLESYVSTQSINSDVVVNCIETFFPKVERKTFIVMDQASIHTGSNILDYLESWRERNIEIFILPSYSPHLNLIEILWRFMKYEWLEIEAYLSWESLVYSVEKILKEYGNQYVINFV